jgi:ABC-type Fe3+-hydroxamate transport system substrate-binding protein
MRNLQWRLAVVCVCTSLSLVSKPVQAEPVQAEPVQAEPVQAEPVQIKPVQAEPVQIKPVQAEPVQIKPVQAEPVQAEPGQAEPGQAGSHPVSVASINLCADQLLLLLADGEQIVSLSKLAHDKAGSRFYKQAQAYPVNQAAAEQILPLQPDLVIAGQFTNSYTIKLLMELGLRVEILPIADTINTMINNI